MKIYFLTTNANKVEEARRFFDEENVAGLRGITLEVISRDVQEILHPDLKVVVRKKALEAYRLLNHPCLVEHGGLFFEGLPDLPGPLGKIIWNAVGERMCDFLRPKDTRATVARAMIGYCDGRRIHLYEGTTLGTVAKRARGKYNTSNWDPIFIPEGETETYGEMGRERKLKTSPLVKAWRAFIDREFPVIKRPSPVRPPRKGQNAARLPKPKRHVSQAEDPPAE